MAVAITEVALTPTLSPTGQVLTVGQGGDSFNPFGDIIYGVWTVPAWLRSFSVYIVGGGGNDAVGTGGESPAGANSPAVFYNVPCTPGDEWLLEAAWGVYHDAPGFAPQRNTYNGGSGIGVPPSSLGYAGGAASVLRRRNGSGTSMFALAAGYGGNWVVASTVTAVADESGIVTYGGFTSEPGAATDGQSSGISDGAGGGAGWPGGEHGPATATAGLSGGMYLPAPNGSSLGGPPSPPFSAVYGSIRPEPWPPSGLGSVFIWYYPENMQGWRVGLGW